MNQHETPQDLLVSRGWSRKLGKGPAIFMVQSGLEDERRSEDGSLGRTLFFGIFGRGCAGVKTPGSLRLGQQAVDGGPSWTFIRGVSPARVYRRISAPSRASRLRSRRWRGRRWRA